MAGNLNTAAIICCHVLNKEEPILYVFHDEDGSWQILCEKEHETGDAKVVSLKSVFDLDNSVVEVANIPCGYVAERRHKEDDWLIRKQY